MIRLIFIVVISLLVSAGCSIGADEEKKTMPKKFKTTLTVVYNAITLEEAAAKEQAFRELYKDACEVDIELEAANETVFIGNASIDSQHTDIGRFEITPNGIIQYQD